ncbi:hypothetical protein HMPREF1982_03757 [Clostridiales bacterium oral taxon 876 str. F0540]|nr:hypothetical protein HMPREF1982_03757 [Clostridiales bacterium oral taxon 876 str. F0540]
MQHLYNTEADEVSILKIFVKSRTKNLDGEEYGYSIDIECCDVFLTDSIKQEIEKLSALLLSYAPEIQIYRHIKEQMPIMEFRASQYMPRLYKVNICTNFEEYMIKIKNYNDIVNLISKSIIERITYLFGAYSLENY